MEKNTDTLASKEYWAEYYRDGGVFPIEFNHPIRGWINDNIPRGTGSCLEIGCFPGRFLDLFGEKGYKLSGIDLVDNTSNLVGAWLEKRGRIVDEIVQGDFNKYCFSRKFDIVSSFGFVEHFKNYKEIICRHADLVSVGGLLVIEAPNFRAPLQYLLHWYFDKANLGRHNIKAMNLNSWKKLLKARGFEIIDSGPIGGFSFWCDDPLISGVKQKRLSYLADRLPFLQKMLSRPSWLYTPYIGIIAKNVNINICK